VAEIHGPPGVRLMRETGWLIEIGATEPRYWDGTGEGVFTADPNGAIRFARECDAECLLSWKVVKPPPGPVRVLEHAWLDDAPDPMDTLRSPDSVPDQLREFSARDYRRENR
jgi:hypothetical protein